MLTPILSTVMRISINIWAHTLVVNAAVSLVGDMGISQRIAVLLQCLQNLDSSSLRLCLYKTAANIPYWQCCDRVGTSLMEEVLAAQSTQ